MPMPSAMRRSRVVELDPEKAAEIKAVELEGERAMGELGGLENGTRFELDGGLGSIKKVVDVVVKSERIQVENGSVIGNVVSKVEDTRVRHNGPSASRKENVANKVEDTSVRQHKETSAPTKGNVASAKKAAITKRDLPPLPTDQGKPGCGKEVTKDCVTKRETEALRKGKRHYSVGPDGTYNYK
jgi:hypothetical protein